jgi:Skp family chaperone for outer membrane proteins
MGMNLSFAVAPMVSMDTESSMTEWIEERQKHSEILKEKLAVAQNRMKLQADKNISEREFQVGEMVLLKLQPYVQTSVVSRPERELGLHLVPK